MAETSYDLSGTRAAPINGRIIAIASVHGVDRGAGGADPRRSLRPRGVGFRLRPRRRLSHRPRTNSACRLRFADRRADALSDLAGRTAFSRRAAVHRPARAGVAHRGAAFRGHRAAHSFRLGFCRKLRHSRAGGARCRTRSIPPCSPRSAILPPTIASPPRSCSWPGYGSCCQKPVATACCWVTC